MKARDLQEIYGRDAACPYDLKAAGYGEVYADRRQLLGEVRRLQTEQRKLRAELRRLRKALGEI